jgi:multicomponent Na+:H+ antiporter subunit B
MSHSEKLEQLISPRIKASVSSVLSATVVIAATICTLMPLVFLDAPWPSALRDHLEERGVQESGARNLVSAIYLGYRAFDTLGETIVLLVAVSGTIGMIAGAGGSLAKGYADVALGDTELPVEDAQAKKRKAELLAADSPMRVAPSAADNQAGSQVRLERSRGHRTELIDVVTGKLGPVVLIFGLYVMMFGHMSPGGGFQGGVVVASGIVFLALGSRAGGRSRITEPGNLARIEAVGFLFLVIASLVGSFTGAGYFGNPLARAGISPVVYIIALNAVIGLKVGAGISFMCVAMLGEAES